MTKIILDPAAATKLSELGEAAELCDASGRVIGFFTPFVTSEMYHGVKPPISEQELLRREQSLHGRTLDEIMADLKRQG
jgi:hypothetical protein